MNSKSYILFFRNSGPDTHQHLSPDQRQDLMTRWNAWYDRLAKDGKAIEGQSLELVSRRISGAKGIRVIDGPFPEAKEVIAGYVKLIVRDLAEATLAAQEHPGLEYGLVIEILALTDDNHLEVTTGTKLQRRHSTRPM